MTPPHTKNPDWNAIARYLAGEATDEEHMVVRAWLDSHPSDARLVAALNNALKDVSPHSEVDVDAALRRVKQRTRETSRQPSSRFAVFAGLAAAAAIVLAVMVSRSRAPSETQVAATPDAQRVITTAVGARDSVTLSDGSKVILGPASSLRVAVNYGAASRDVELVGEALFDVVHNASKTFTVRAGSALVRDIGTSFSVHSDAGENHVRVVVSSGVVQLSRGTSAVMLKKGDVGDVSSTGNVLASQGAATDEDLAWTRGRLVFRDASLAEVSADLRRWYGVHLQVTDSAMLRRHLTASFTNDPIDRVLSVISLALGAHVERRGDSAIVRPVTRQQGR